MYSGTKLIDALAKQHQTRSQSELFKSGTFTLDWRAKVGSHLHPDTETIVSAGEPCGSWLISLKNNVNNNRPEDKRNVGENWKSLKELPLNGYIPAASIRGIVRAWVAQHPDLIHQMKDLLGYQTESSIVTGKIEFLDAFPTTATKLSLDIVNPQQHFQVFHEGQSTPLSLYTLGDGHSDIEINVAIRGTRQATAADVSTVWEWVQQALSSHGIGSRTASGYGALTAPAGYQASPELPKSRKDYSTKTLSFTLYSQGNAGPNPNTPELRPTHWRGWLRSWLLRFFLGVMSKDHAEFTVGELLGTLDKSTDGKSRAGSVKLKIIPDLDCWGEKSTENGALSFYTWKGDLELSAPTTILNEIILPVLEIAARIGGVGKGWRRPLHIFMMTIRGEKKKAARGCHLKLNHQVEKDGEITNPFFGANLNAADWSTLYNNWKNAVRKYWENRYSTNINPVNAEVFSPRTCAVYLVPGSQKDPIDPDNFNWIPDRPTDTRGRGMDLIYQDKYKRQLDVGGNAGYGNAACSWASIKRINRQNGCKEVVCIFMGDGKTKYDRTQELKSDFLKDLARIDGAEHLFGKQPNQITIRN
jgi:CRISPR-associated protein Cmr6